MKRIKLEDSRNAMTGASPAWIAMLLSAAVACGGSGASAPDGTGAQSATIGTQGGEIVGAKGSALEGVKLTIPAGALASDTPIEIRPSAEEASLPSSAVRSGPQFAIGPAGTPLAIPARVTLPFDEDVVTANDRFDDDVEVWLRDGDHFERNRCTNPVWRVRRERRILGAWNRASSGPRRPGGQFAATCSAAAVADGGGTVRGPISAASSAGSSWARVSAQYLGASSR
jgi:hypothetical protein